MDKLGTVPLRDLDAPEDGPSDASLAYGPCASASNRNLARAIETWLVRHPGNALLRAHSECESRHRAEDRWRLSYFKALGAAGSKAADH